MELTATVVGMIVGIFGTLGVLLRLAFQTGGVVRTLDPLHSRLCRYIKGSEQDHVEIHRKIDHIAERVRDLEVTCPGHRYREGADEQRN